MPHRICVREGFDFWDGGVLVRRLDLGLTPRALMVWLLLEFGLGRAFIVFTWLHGADGPAF